MPDPAPPYTLAETWQLNNRVNLRLLEELSEEQLAYTPNPKARNIGDQLGHLHNARILWLEAQAPKLAKALTKIEKGASQGRYSGGSQRLGRGFRQAHRGSGGWRKT